MDGTSDIAELPQRRRLSTAADIAIIGMSAILPGAPDVRRYWENILARVCSIQEIPPDRWPVALYYDPAEDSPDKIQSKWGGFIDDVPFDPLRFGIPPASLPSIDPMQLLGLVAVEAALRDAGLTEIPPDMRQRVSVILGFTGGLGELGVQYGARSELTRALDGEVAAKALAHLPRWTPDSFAGLLPNVIAGRIANRFDFGGVNYTVDAACASSLAAVRQAVMELKTGHSDVVICGSVETGLGPFGYACFSNATALSRTGACRTFDAGADGTTISEGVAMLVLKRLEDAEAAGDRIYAIIKGVGGSSDGRAKGLMAPLPSGQKRALERAYGQAGYSPATVELFEAHGTGTVAGDAAEIESLSTLLTESGARPRSSAVGSVKTMIGHTKGTAGLAGLIKATLALHHRVFPPHLGVAQLNTALADPACPIALHQQMRPWLSQGPRRAGVSGFGFGGTNFHVTLEEYPDRRARPAARATWPAELFVWRAKDRAALAECAGAVLSKLELGAVPSLAGLAHALADALGEGQATLAIVTNSHATLRTALAQSVERLRGNDDKPFPPGIYFSDAPLAAAGKIAMLFSGQGSQYPDMLREAASVFDEVRGAIEEADAVLSRTPTYEQRADPRLSRLIYPFERFGDAEEEAAKRALAATDVAQPALGAVECGLLALTSRLGIVPDMVAGHSYGEYVALHAAGVLSRGDLLRVSEARGRFIVGATRDGDLGTMAAVTADVSTVRKAIAGLDVVAANANAPNQTVISGAREAVGKAIEALTASGLAASPIPVAAAFHSPLMQPAQEPLARFFDTLDWSAPRIPVYANTTAAPHDMQPEHIRALLERHLTEPVDFQGMIEAMYADGARIFLEIGPKSVLSGLARRILDKRPHIAVSLDGSSGGLNGLLHGLAALMVQGVMVDLSRLFEGRAPPVDLGALAPPSEPLSPHVWLVNGARAQPASAAPPARHETKPEPARTAVAVPVRTQPQQAKEKAMDGEFAGPVLKGGSHSAGEPVPTGAERAMADYHQIMRQFLQMQERLMMAYLGGGSRVRPFAGGRAGQSLPLATPMPVAAPAPFSIAPTPPPAPAPYGVAPTPPPAPAPVATLVSDPTALLLKLASECTGYPEEMLGLDLNLGADLGIDSIKWVEIVGAFLKAQPAAVAERLSLRMKQLTSATTLQEALSLTADAFATEDAPRPFDLAGEGEGTSLPRYVLRAEAEDRRGLAGRVPGGIYLIVPDRTGLAQAVARRLEDDGAEVQVVPEDASEAWFGSVRARGRIRGLIHLRPVDDAHLHDPPYAIWRARMQEDVKDLFRLLRLAADDLMERGIVLIASAMGGQFGRDALRRERRFFPGAGGGVGLVKCLAKEWTACLCKAVDLDPAEDAERQGGHIHAELADASGRREVGYPEGARTIFRTVPANLAAGTPLAKPDESWVVLAIGGARGITAETLREFAAARATCIVVQRSKLAAPECGETVSLPDARSLRAHFLLRARQAGERTTPAQIEAQINAVLRDREIRANLDDFRAMGASIDYRVCDVRAEQDVAALLGDLYTRYGRIDAVLFGAGLIEDQLLVNKTSESLTRVFDTKVDGAYLLSRHLRAETLRLFALFTSVAGRYGNRGQTDYGAANEVLNRFAWQLQAQWGPSVKVAAVNWGPWACTTHGSGMLTPETTRKFRDLGISLVEPEAGRGFLMRELLYAPHDEVEVIAGEYDWDRLDEIVAESAPAPATAEA